MVSEFTSVNGVSVGAPAYAAPEVIGGQRASFRSDLYALGCVIFELLRGQAPFAGSHARAILDAHLQSPVPPLPTDLPPALTPLVMSLLAKEPRQRPLSAQQVRRSLEAISSTFNASAGLAERDADVRKAAKQARPMRRSTTLRGLPVASGSEHTGSFSIPGAPAAANTNPPRPAVSGAAGRISSSPAPAGPPPMPAPAASASPIPPAPLDAPTESGRPLVSNRPPPPAPVEPEPTRRSMRPRVDSSGRQDAYVVAPRAGANRKGIWIAVGVSLLLIAGAVASTLLR